MTKRKALGQHFLRSRSALHQILTAISPEANDLIMEIGAGKGVLTFPLAEKCGQLLAIEKDPQLIPFLTRQKPPNLHVLQADILRVDWEKIIAPFQPWPGEVKLVGNLPFSISSPLLFLLLRYRHLFSYVVFLLQREVAERVCARPGSKAYAPLSILFHLYFEPKLLKIFPATIFSPVPQVEAGLVSLRRRRQPLFAIQDEERFPAFLHQCFGHRRKTLANNLKLSGWEEEKILAGLNTNSLPLNIRPEQVDISGFIALFNYFRKELIRPEKKGKES